MFHFETICLFQNETMFSFVFVKTDLFQLEAILWGFQKAKFVCPERANYIIL
jgi:hypothetical protein